jgi:hypothetical protein
MRSLDATSFQNRLEREHESLNLCSITTNTHTVNCLQITIFFFFRTMWASFIKLESLSRILQLKNIFLHTQNPAPQLESNSISLKGLLFRAFLKIVVVWLCFCSARFWIFSISFLSFSPVNSFCLLVKYNFVEFHNYTKTI